MQNINKRELKISTSWAIKNPDLYFEAVRAFHEENRSMSKRVDASQSGFVIYIAEPDEVTTNEQVT